MSAALPQGRIRRINHTTGKSCGQMDRQLGCLQEKPSETGPLLQPPELNRA